MSIVLIVAGCGLMAAVREFLAIKYYAAVFGGVALRVSVLGFLIGLADYMVLAISGFLFLKGYGYNSFIPFIAYEFFGAIGAYIGVQHGNMRDRV